MVKKIEIPPYLDAKEERINAIEWIRDRVFDLLIERNDVMNGLTNLGPHRPKCQKRLKEIEDEIIWRINDYKCFMWDFKQDWDFDEEERKDYGLEKCEEPTTE